MPDTGFIVLSLLSVVLGAMFFMFPRPLQKLSGALDRTFVTLDQRLMRYRYLVGLLLFVGSYAFFKISLFIPALR